MDQNVGLHMAVTDVQRKRTHKAAHWRTFIEVKLNACRPPETLMSLISELKLFWFKSRRHLTIFQRKFKVSVHFSRWMSAKLHRLSTHVSPSELRVVCNTENVLNAAQPASCFHCCNGLRRVQQRRWGSQSCTRLGEKQTGGEPCQMLNSI